ALRRAVRWGDGWMPIGLSPDLVAPPIAELQALAAKAGRPRQEVVMATSLPLDDPSRAAEAARAYAEVGVTSLVHGWRYADAAAFRKAAEVMAGPVREALGS